MNKKMYVLSFIILCFFVLNFLTMYDKSIFVDEAFSYYMINTLSYKEILQGQDVHPPLMSLFYKSLPNHNNFFMLRFYSLIITTISIIIFSSTLYKHYSFKHSLIVTIFLSSSMTISHYSTHFRMYSLLFLFNVMSLKYIIEKKYYYSLTMIILSILTHYYSVFLLIPYVISLYIYDIKHLKKSFSDSLKRVRITVITVFILLIVMSPYIYHQITDNEYKLPPPHYKSTLSSLPSVLIFPFVIPSMITNKFLFMISFLIIFFIIYLIYTNKDSYDKQVYYYSIISFITMILFFLSSMIFTFPYHHRYTIMFYPVIFYMIVNSLTKKTKVIRSIIVIIITSYLLLTSFQYHVNPENKLLQLSQNIECPKNILHETPFSFLPMKMYLPECNHYIYLGDDWKGVTHKTLYTKQNYVNQQKTRYDIYISNFDELLGKSLLINSPNIQIIRVD